jgi:UDP-3-O-[3-hydroxymyristoyl] glucosamine N-acyltransferase
MLKLILKIFAPRGNKMTAGDIAKKFGLEIRGDPAAVVTGVAPIADAKRGDIAFYSTERNAEVFRILPIDVLRKTSASVILLQPEQIGDAPAGRTLLISNTPRGEIVKILGIIYAKKPKRGIHFTAHVERGVYFRRKHSVYIGPNAIVEQGAVLGENVRIDAGAFVGAGVKLGKNTVVHAGAHIENADVCADCVIYPGACVGKDGFGFTRQNGKNAFIPHVGRVVLGDRVSVGANSAIDRGLMSDTRVGDGTKIDNLVQVAHGVIIGRECFLASGTGIAGGCVVGDRVMFGGHAGIANGLTIGDDAEVGPNSGVFRNVKPGEKVLGYPATNAIEYFRMFAWVKQQIKKQGE